MSNTNYGTTDRGNEGGFWSDVAPMMRGVKPADERMSELVQARKAKVLKQDIITSSEAELKKPDTQFAQDFHQTLQKEAALTEELGRPLTVGGGTGSGGGVVPTKHNASGELSDAYKSFMGQKDVIKDALGNPIPDQGNHVTLNTNELADILRNMVTGQK